MLVSDVVQKGSVLRFLVPGKTTAVKDYPAGCRSPIKNLPSWGFLYVGTLKEITYYSKVNLQGIWVLAKERWNIYSHEWKISKNGRMEQSKAMEYESRKASSDVLKPRNIYIYIYIYLFVYLFSIKLSLQESYTTFLSKLWLHTQNKYYRVNTTDWQTNYLSDILHSSVMY